MSEARRFARLLAEARIVHLDAPVFALHLSAHPRYLPLTRGLLAGLAAGDFEARTSALTVYQLLAEPHRRGRAEAAERVEACLAAFPGLEIVPLTASIAGQAAAVRARIGGSFARAAQIATALAGDAELFVTQSSTLRRVAGLGVEQLDAHVSG